jgi:hypothetical protein
MRVRFAAVSLLLLLASCAGPEPLKECQNWVRAACGYLQGCGEVTDVESCVAENLTGDEATTICPSFLKENAFCSDLGDDFINCAEAFKTKACGVPDATLCILYTSSASECPVPNTVRR